MQAKVSKNFMFFVIFLSPLKIFFFEEIDPTELNTFYVFRQHDAQIVLKQKFSAGFSPNAEYSLKPNIKSFKRRQKDCQDLLVISQSLDVKLSHILWLIGSGTTCNTCEAIPIDQPSFWFP